MAVLADLRERAFTREAEYYRLKPEFSRGIRFLQQDIRQTTPAAAFDLVLCRNLVFTYFDEDLQQEVLDRISAGLKTEGALVIGIHERLPEGSGGFTGWSTKLGIYRKTV